MTGRPTPLDWQIGLVEPLAPLESSRSPACPRLRPGAGGRRSELEARLEDSDDQRSRGLRVAQHPPVGLSAQPNWKDLLSLAEPNVPEHVSRRSPWTGKDVARQSSRIESRLDAQRSDGEEAGGRCSFGGHARR